jgi:hypothetical protein
MAGAPSAARGAREGFGRVRPDRRPGRRQVVVLYVEQEESVRRQMMRAQLASLHNQCARPPARPAPAPPPARLARSGERVLSAVLRTELQEWRAPDLQKLSSRRVAGAQPGAACMSPCV